MPSGTVTPGGISATQVATSGKVLPFASQVATVSVDTTTYDNPVTSGKLRTLVVNADDATLAIALAGDAFPRILFLSNPADAVVYMGDGTFSPTNGAAYAYLTGSNGERMPLIEAASCALKVGDKQGGSDPGLVFNGAGGLSLGGPLAATGGIGAFNHAPPAAQPAHPVTLADVIAILTAAGLCAA